MDNARSAAERVRPILQAMERSIDTARQRRLHTSGIPVREMVPVTPIKQETSEAVVGQDGEPAPRLKARPKRASPLSTYDPNSLRSRAG